MEEPDWKACRQARKGSDAFFLGLVFCFENNWSLLDAPVLVMAKTSQGRTGQGMI